MRNKTVGSTREHVPFGLQHQCSARGLLVPGDVFCSFDLQAMRRDGVIRHVFGEAYLPHQAEETPEHRALACSWDLPEHLRGTLVLSGLTAAWVYTGYTRPPRVTAFFCGRTRAGLVPPYLVPDIRLTRLYPAEKRYLAGIALTSLERTGLDLLTQPRCPTGWPQPQEALQKLATLPGFRETLTKIGAAIERYPAKERFRAQARLSRMTMGKEGYLRQNVFRQ